MDSEALPRIEKGSPAFRRVNGALFLGGFASFGLLHCLQPLLPVLSQFYGVSATQSSLALSVSTLTLAVGLLITGPLSDAWGRKPLMVAALCAAAVCTLLLPWVPNWQSFLLVRALVGLSLSGLAAVAMSYLSEEVDPRYLGLAMGLYISGNSLGGMSGRLVSGVLTDVGSWRLAMGLLGAVALIMAAWFWRWLPASQHFQARTLSFASLRQGLRVHVKDAGLPWLFLEAFLLMGSFATLFNYMGYRLLAPPYALSMTWEGLLSAVYVSGTYSAAQAGVLADRWGRARVFWPAIGIMLLGLLLTLSDVLSLIFVGMAVFAFGFFAAHSLASGWVGQRAVQARAQASSLYLFSYYLGSSVLGTLGGHFWQTGQWLGVFGFISALLVAALGIAWYLRHLEEG